MRKRSIVVVLAFATVLALASSAIPGKAIVNYQDIDACTAGCTVAAAGWPVPYLADYPRQSPSTRTSLIEAATGSDRFLWTAFVATWLAWAALVGVLAWAVRRRRKPEKRRRL